MNGNYSGYPAFNPYPQTSNGINWVQGLEGAKAYQLPPNSNVVLLDSETERFYIKVSDNIGMCNLRVFEFKEITAKQPVSSDMSQFVTRDEFQKLVDALGGLEHELPLRSTKE